MKYLITLLLTISLCSSVWAEDLMGRYRKLPSCILAESLSSIEDLERKGWTIGGNPTMGRNAYGGYLDLDGTGDDIDLPSGLGPIMSTGTIILWFTLDGITEGDVIFFMGDGAEDLANAIYFQILSNKVECYVKYSSGTEIATSVSQTVTTGKQYMVAFTYDTTSGIEYLYDSGTAYTNTDSTVSNLPTTDRVMVGAYYGGNDNNGKYQNLLIFNRVLSATEISDIYYGTTFDYDKDLVSHWDMSEVNPQDIGWKGNGNDGTGTGLVASTDVVYEGGDWGVEFNGSDENIDISGVGDLVDAVSIAVKFKSTNLGAWDTIINKSVSTSNRIAMGLRDDGTLAGGVLDTSWTSKSTAATLVANTIYHSVMTYDGTTTGLYVDGVAQTGTSDSPSSDTAGFTIGSHTGDGNWFDGVVYDARIYNTGLTYMQAEDLYVREGR